MSRTAYTSTPHILPLTYESHLPRFSADVLKRMARLWVGKEAAKLNKAGCSKAIATALADPERVRAVAAGLSDFEQAGLGLLKFHGQTAPTRELAMELLMLGIPFAKQSSNYGYYSRDTYEALNLLLNKGLLILRDWENTYGYSSRPDISDYHYQPDVFADVRLLEHVEMVPPVPLSLTPVTRLEAGFAKQPAEVALRLISMAEALRKIGRIDLTKKGRPSKPFLSKLTKTLGWDETHATETSTPLLEATSFFFQLFAGARFIRPVSDSDDPMDVWLDPKLDATFEAPYEAQAAVWARAYQTLTGWVEYRPPSVYLSEDELFQINKFNDFRTALLMALAALPDGAVWYRITDLSEALYERIGDRFTLGYGGRYYYFPNTKDADEQRRKSQERAHASWLKEEQPWILHALTGPLFHLGFVELAVAAGGSSGSKTDSASPTLVRLTELGRAVLYERFRPAQGGQRVVRTVSRPDQDGSCWIVQPNFDVVVYLDRASPARLTFLERIAKRKPSEGATAQYHLTRETVYAGLEAGVNPNSLVETLSQACEYPLPANIQQTLTDWAARREQLSVYRAGSILEFPDQHARDTAQAKQKLTGVPVGDRFLLLVGSKRIKSVAALVSQTIDYSGLPVRCVKAAEDGTLQINKAKADLLIRGELATWAEPDPDDENRWRITQKSIQRALSAGWTAEKIIDSLSLRLPNPLPPLLAVAIRAWAKVRTKPTAVAVATDLILQVADAETAHAIGGSSLLQPYLQSRLGPSTFLVDRKMLKELRKKLEGLGLEVGSDLTLEEFRYLTG